MDQGRLSLLPSPFSLLRAYPLVGGEATSKINLLKSLIQLLLKFLSLKF